MSNCMVVGTWAESYNSDRGGKLILYQYKDGKTAPRQTIDTGKSISVMTCDRKRNLLFAVCETNYHDANLPMGYELSQGQNANVGCAYVVQICRTTCRVHRSTIRIHLEFY